MEPLDPDFSPPASLPTSPPIAPRRAEKTSDQPTKLSVPESTEQSLSSPPISHNVSGGSDQSYSSASDNPFAHYQNSQLGMQGQSGVQAQNQSRDQPKCLLAPQLSQTETSTNFIPYAIGGIALLGLFGLFGFGIFSILGESDVSETTQVNSAELDPTSGEPLASTDQGSDDSGIEAVAPQLDDTGLDVDIAEETNPVEIIGEPIEPLGDSGVFIKILDPGFGKQAPTLKGTSFDGTQIAIEPDGRIKVIYFLAHWCPHCQAEVPVVQKLIDQGRLPSEIDVYSVSTLVSPERENYPPSSWLELEQWTPQVILDDESGSAKDAFGLEFTPHVVYLDGENKILARTVGSLSPEETLQVWEAVSN